MNRNGRPTHGLSNTPTYRAWSRMKTRCLNPRRPDFKYYGGRGVSICERWMNYQNFLADMGEVPARMTLDRHPDKSGNYEPGNCRWADMRAQNRNRTSTKLTLDDAKEIGRRSRNGEGSVALALEFGIGRCLVRQIATGRKWPDASEAEHGDFGAACGDYARELDDSAAEDEDAIGVGDCGAAGRS